MTERRPMLTPEALAEYLGDVSVDTLREWRRRDRGPAWLKVGKHIRYRWQDVEAWERKQLHLPAA